MIARERFGALELICQGRDIERCALGVRRPWLDVPEPMASPVRHELCPILLRQALVHPPSVEARGAQPSRGRVPSRCCIAREPVGFPRILRSVTVVQDPGGVVEVCSLEILSQELADAGASPAIPRPHLVVRWRPVLQAARVVFEIGLVHAVQLLVHGHINASGSFL